MWLLFVGAGFGIVLKYQVTSGGVGQSPSQWPSNTFITLDSQHDTLIMFAHPQCSCTRASIEELNRILAQYHDRLTAEVWFFKPKDLTGWNGTALEHDAAAIPGVVVKDDIDGQQARLFGAETSGFVLLYDRQGKLLFKGGITGSRGHAGDNSGENSIVALVSGQCPPVTETPVYGCSLHSACAYVANSDSK
ncbi:MAG TPA: hypothetical protein VGN61_13730 [Verrucomicrobiae bacterium]